MTETRDFSIEVAASLTSGVLLCSSFSELHEAAEFVLGHQIWTHHFASPVLWEEIRKTVLAQCPGLPTKIEGVTAENIADRIATIGTNIGQQIVHLRRGGGLTAQLPTDGIPDHMKDTAIILRGPN